MFSFFILSLLFHYLLFSSFLLSSYVFLSPIFIFLKLTLYSSILFKKKKSFSLIFSVLLRPAFWVFPHRSRNSNDCPFILPPLYFFSFQLLFRLFIKPSLFSFSSSFHPYFNFLMKPFEYFALSFPRHLLISILDFIYFFLQTSYVLPRFFPSSNFNFFIPPSTPSMILFEKQKDKQTKKIFQILLFLF